MSEEAKEKVKKDFLTIHPGLRLLSLDVTIQTSVDKAVSTVIEEDGEYFVQ